MSKGYNPRIKKRNKMKTTKIIAKIASKINTSTLLKIDNLLMALKLNSIRSIISGELMGRNDLIENI